MNKVILIDLLNVFYRSFYSLKNLNNSKGIPTNAIYSFCKFFIKIVKNINPDYIIAIDDSRSFYRKEIFPDYKNNRNLMPSEMVIQKDFLNKFLELINIDRLKIEGYEADDIIYNIVNDINKDENEIYIITADKDLHYLSLNKNVFIFDPLKNIIINKEKVFDIYNCLNCTKDKIWLYYSLVGDSSDNIPGIKGVGDKTAEYIMNNYESIEDLYNRVENDNILKKRIKDLILNNKEILIKSYNLIKPIELNNKEKNIFFINKEKKWNIKNIKNSIDLIKELEMNSILKDKKIFDEIDLEDKSSNEIFKEKKEELVDYIFNHFKVNIYNLENKNEFEKEIKNSKVIAVDVETRGGDYRKTLMVGFSLCTEENLAWYIPLYINNIKVSDYDEKIKIFSSLKNHKWLLHGAISDLTIIINSGGEISNDLFDTMIAADVNLYEKVGLKELSLKIFNERMMTFSEVVKNGEYKFFDDVPLDIGSRYAASDARQTFKLYKYFYVDNPSKDYFNLIDNVEMPLIKVLLDMEINGINCDKNILLNQLEIVKEKLDLLKNKILEITNSLNILNFNPLSPKQVSNLIYDVLKLQNNNKKSTDYKNLLEIIDKHPIVNLIIKYREYYVLSSKFINGLIESICEDGKIRTHFNQLFISTGRLSSYNPNLQNIPIDQNGISIRSSFIAKKEFKIISLDYSQIELRVLAHFSKDENLINFFKNNEDVHKKTAADIFEKNLELVTEEERRIAKKINFGIIYGLTAYGLSKDLQIKTTKAKEYIDKYKKLYPGVFDWIDKLNKETIEKGYVKTYFGRKRIIKEIKDQNKNIAAFGLRIAVNTVIQGTAAEIMKKSMIEIYNYLKNTKNKLILQIHDEVLIESLAFESNEIMLNCKNIMENILKLDLKLKVNSYISDHW